VLYQRVPRLFTDLALARGDGRHPRILRALGRVDLLILDDWGLEPLDAAARHDLLEILEDRYGRRSTIVTSQLPVDQWHALIGPTPSSTASSITPTGSTSTARACGGPASPAAGPEPVALWTCRCAWTTPRGVAHMSTAEAATENDPFEPRFKIDPAACPMPENQRQNASRPGRDQIGTVGEIISESWARSNRNTRARSSESAPYYPFNSSPALGRTIGGGVFLWSGLPLWLRAIRPTMF
jgi:IstB-like ATP binding protein